MTRFYKNGKDSPLYGRTYSKEHRKAISDSLKGHVVSNETKKKIGDANRGLKRSDDVRKAHSKRMKGKRYALGFQHTEESKETIRRKNSGENGYWYGKNLSEETKRKISEAKSGEKSNFWKGGRIVDKQGYVLLYKPDYPYHTYANYIQEHRFVMEQHIGRLLRPGEIIHHIDGDPQNNMVKNLMITNNSEHRRIHRDN